MKRIKSYLKYIIITLVNIYYKIKFKTKNNKKRILVYTDSRGFLMNCFLCNKTPKNSYIDMLSRHFKIDYQLCTKKHTTILDFLQYINNKDLDIYSHILLHLGIVDFSPRPLSQFDMVYNTKNNISKNIFPNIEMKANYYEDIYDNEKTFSLYDFDFLTKSILPKLNEISNNTKIIWLGINKVDLKWNGNYTKKRPLNINNILLYQERILEYLKNNANNIKYIEIDNIEEFELKKSTIDNMHLTKYGFNLFYHVLIKELI